MKKKLYGNANFLEGLNSTTGKFRVTKWDLYEKLLDLTIIKTRDYFKNNKSVKDLINEENFIRKENTYFNSCRKAIKAISENKYSSLSEKVIEDFRKLTEELSSPPEKDIFRKYS